MKLSKYFKQNYKNLTANLRYFQNLLYIIIIRYIILPVKETKFKCYRINDGYPNI